MTREDLEEYIENYTGGDLGSGKDLYVAKGENYTIYSWNCDEHGKPRLDFLISDDELSDCACPMDICINFKKEPYKAKKFVQEAIFSGSYEIAEYIRED